MVAMPKTVETGPPVILSPATRNLTGDEVRADLRWGDEAPKPDAIIRRPRAGQAVICSDGYAGRIVSTTADASGQLRTVAVRLGRFWGREVSVPAALIETYDGTTVRLGVQRRTLHALPGRRSDVDTAAAGRGALHAAGVLHGADYGDVSVAACDGAMNLTGHVRTRTEKSRAEGALAAVPGVLAVQNDLIADDDLITLVSQALAGDERTRHETIFVASSLGVVILSGLDNCAIARAAAEECAARVPFVRGVSNYIEAPGVLVDTVRERVVQPRIGQEVFASDMALGRVAQVIINPHNRRTEAIVVYGQFPDRRRATSRMQSYEMPMEKRSLVIPLAEVSVVTPTVVQLNIGGMAASQCNDFAPKDFVRPDRMWRPPYPFTLNDCLWTTT